MVEVDPVKRNLLPAIPEEDDRLRSMVVECTLERSEDDGEERVAVVAYCSLEYSLLLRWRFRRSLGQ